MDVEKYYKELEEEGHSYEKCSLHYCREWDELPVCKHSMEFNNCMCTDETNEKEKEMSDAVSHPSHYNSGKIEVIEALEDWGLGFHRGNAVKYIARAGKKDPNKEVEDLEKAVWYIKREIERLKARKEGREPVRPNDMNPRAEAKHDKITF